MEDFDERTDGENNDGMGYTFIIIIIVVCLSIIVAGGVGAFIFTNKSGSTTNKPIDKTDSTGNQIGVPGSADGNAGGNTSGNANTIGKPISTTKKPVTNTKKPITTKRPGLVSEPDEDEDETTTQMPIETEPPTNTGTDEKNCPSNTNRIGNLCWYDRGAGEFPGCSSGSVKKGVECYKKPPEGWDWTTEGGLMIGKKCPSDVNDSGTTCWYDRGIGTLPGCPTGKVQKAAECYEKPPEGWDWTTPGGLLIGKICPSDVNDSGTTCWYDRGAGRIPDLKPCAEGLRDDGVSCWRDTYGRGAGRSPNLYPCESGQRDDGLGSCWLDSYGRGAGRTPNKAACGAGESDDGTSCWVLPDTYTK
jgi:hypothetical protein